MNNNKQRKLTKAQLEKKVRSLERRIARAYSWAGESMVNDGGHHKVWFIDQIVRTLAGREYAQIARKQIVRWAKGDDYYPWDEGMAP